MAKLKKKKNNFNCIYTFNYDHKYKYKTNLKFLSKLIDWSLICVYCIPFRKAYDSIHRENPYNIMEEFGINNKLLTLIKIYMEGTKYQVRVDSILSHAFTVETELKQGGALSPLLFNLALE